MNIKHLNEECRKILNETGFAVSGQKDEVNDILAKLTQEYGDLTIPEFIDKLIQAEQKGEEILEESLNESYMLNDSIFTMELMNHSFKNLKFEFYNGSSSLYIRPKFGGESTCIEYVQLISGRESNNSIEYIVKGRLVGSLNSMDKKLTNKVSTNTEYGSRSGKTYYYVILSSGVYSKQESKQKINKDLANKFIKVLKEIDDEMEKENNSLDSEVEQLQQIKQQVKNSRTTVRQALSKSAIAKKIQALQNPTPEQLAKILAAIEG